MSIVRESVNGDVRTASRAMAALFGADDSDPEVRAGATLLSMALLRLIRPQLDWNI